MHLACPKRSHKTDGRRHEQSIEPGLRLFQPVSGNGMLSARR